MPISIPSLNDTVNNLVANVQKETGITDSKVIQHGFIGGIIAGLAQHMWSFLSLQRRVEVWIITKVMTGSSLDLFGKYLTLSRKQPSFASGNLNIQGILGTMFTQGTVFSG